MALAKQFFWMILKIAIVVNLVVCSLICVFRHQLASLLTTNDENEEEVVSMIASVMRLVSV